jgi:hypothetical protein
MSRIAEGLAKKGSQKWLQRVVNEAPEMLNAQLKSQFKIPKSESITLFSPSAADDFAEYRDQAFLDLLGIQPSTVSLKEFWPTRGPQWDGLAKSDSGKIYLIEAKAHIPEINSPGTAAGPKALARIQESLNRTKTYLGVRTERDWSSSFYQYTNRLAHLYFLRVLNDLPAYLVFVYFVNDTEMDGPKTKAEWQSAIKLLHSYLGIGKHKLAKYIADVFVDVRELRGK